MGTAENGDAENVSNSHGVSPAEEASKPLNGAGEGEEMNGARQPAEEVSKANGHIEGGGKEEDVSSEDDVEAAADGKDGNKEDEKEVRT